jgi:HD-GYP domain-containing protein (c-di-GMP phosphodiesterase class II)
MRTRVTVTQTAAGIALLVLPMVLFAAMRLRNDLDATVVLFRLHFYVVSAVAVVALLLSILVGIAAYHTRDVRTLFLALGFLSLSGIFLAHGLGSGDSMLMASGTHVQEEEDEYFGGGSGDLIVHHDAEASDEIDMTHVAHDLGAVVEGLFQRSMVGGLQPHDPTALTDLSVAVAAKDGSTGAHLERVADVSEQIGRRLGLDEKELAAVRCGGRLHDLGKIGIPDRLLNKPGKLTAAEFEQMKLHTIRGDAVALRSGMLTAAAPAIRSHHEKRDGSGYPDGLRGDQIPLIARIVSVADVFDALTSALSYKEAWPREAALEEIRWQRGRTFDPACVDALLATLGVPGVAAVH